MSKKVKIIKQSIPLNYGDYEDLYPESDEENNKSN